MSDLLENLVKAGPPARTCFSTAEKELLLALVGCHKSIIENKKTGLCRFSSSNITYLM
jgi:hypothetical protein